ncbi:MAG: aldo/keto reductase [Nitratireductor sp.]
MQQRSLYKNGPKVGSIGLGAMSIGGFFGATDKQTSLKMLEKCVDLNVTHVDTALIYGPYISETVIGEFLKGRPNPFHIATKGGIIPSGRGIDNSEAYLRECLEGSFERLGVDYVDLYYIHRREQDIPIEDVMTTLLKFKEEGKIGGIGFSEISPASLKRASKIGHVDAVQSEYSLWTRLPELGMLQTCAKLETTFVPFSPVARGMITDKGVDPSTFTEIDFRRSVPRFMEPNYSANVEIINQFKAYAKDNGHTSQALALAWVLHQDENCIPIPGTRTAEHLEELVAGASIKLSATQLAEIEEILPVGFAHGNRYSDAQQKPTEVYC